MSGQKGVMLRTFPSGWQGSPQAGQSLTTAVAYRASVTQEEQRNLGHAAHRNSTSLSGCEAQTSVAERPAPRAGFFRAPAAPLRREAHRTRSEERRVGKEGRARWAAA